MPISLPAGESREQMTDIVVGYLNLYPEDWDGLDRMIASLFGPQIKLPEGWRAVRWVEEADLDQDGIDEIVLAYGVPFINLSGYLPLDSADITDRWSVLVRVDGGYRLAYRGTEGWHGVVLNTPRFEFVRDVNGDGQLELVVTTGVCGTVCSETVHIGQWDGETWHTLGQFSVRHTGQVQWVDQDGDGSEEVLLHDGTVCSTYMVPHRPSTYVYAYRDGQYQLIDQRKDPSTHIYFTMLDANEALANGEYDRALELASRNLEQPTLSNLMEHPCGSDFESVTQASYVRIMAYSGIEAMLIHGLRSEPDEMLSLLARIEQDYDREGNPYVQAARCLWETYSASGDIESACRVMQ
jgi:hypothetical protein